MFVVVCKWVRYLQCYNYGMSTDIATYHAAQTPRDKSICRKLYEIINTNLPDAERKVWHRHPVWFLDGNPIVGYSKLKGGVRLMFWSGRDFDEAALEPGAGKFKDASIRYQAAADINEADLKRWLKKARTIQWDYKNIVKRKGELVRLR